MLIHGNHGFKLKSNDSYCSMIKKTPYHYSPMEKREKVIENQNPSLLRNINFKIILFICCYVTLLFNSNRNIF